MQGLLLQYTDDTFLICTGPTPTEADTVINSVPAYINSEVDCCQQYETKSTVMWFRVPYRKQPFEFPDIASS